MKDPRIEKLKNEAIDKFIETCKKDKADAAWASLYLYNVLDELVEELEKVWKKEE
jgi:hypothetical protein